MAGKAISRCILEEQKRKVPRFPFHWKVTVVFDESEEQPRLHGRTQDISTHGCAILSERNVFSKHPVTILLQLPPEQVGRSKRVVEAKGRMVYTVLSSSHHKFRFGIQFLSFKAGDKAQLKKALEDRTHTSIT